MMVTLVGEKSNDADAIVLNYDVIEKTSAIVNDKSNNDDDVVIDKSNDDAYDKRYAVINAKRNHIDSNVDCDVIGNND